MFIYSATFSLMFLSLGSCDPAGDWTLISYCYKGKASEELGAGVIFCTVSIVFFTGFHETAAGLTLPIPAHLPQVEAGLKYANNF